MGFVLKSARFLHLHSPRPGNRFPSELEWSRRLEAPALALCQTFSDVLRTHLYSTKISRSPIKPHAAPPVPVGDVRWRSGGRLPRRPWHCECLGLLRSAKSSGSRPARGVCTLHANYPCGSVFLLAFWGAREGRARASSRLGSVQVGLGRVSELGCVCGISPLRVSP